MRRRVVLAIVGLTASCASLLGLAEHQLRRPFEHHPHLVEGVGCLRCHEGVASAGELGPTHIPQTDSCVSCHEKPHDPRPCGGCHGLGDVELRAAEARLHLRFTHERHVSVVKGNCAKCHLASEPSLTAKMGTCLGCHPHEEQWTATSCDPCHVDLPAEALRPASHVPHGPDYVARHGIDAASSRELCASCHSERSCARCHAGSVPVVDARFAFDRVDRARLHPAGFAGRHALEARSQPGTCNTCHAPESCAECHQARGVGATGAFHRGPHPVGWVGATGNAHGPAARLDPASCASCHGGAGEKLCVDCHEVGKVGGNPHPPGFSSNKPMKEQPCRLCHTRAAP